MSHPNIDYNSPDWHRVVDKLTEERNEYLNFILNKDVDHTHTSFYRGRIAMIDAILDWNPYNSR